MRQINTTAGYMPTMTLRVAPQRPANSGDLIVKWLVVLLALCAAPLLHAATPAPAPLTGKVLEAKEAGTYTYLRLQTRDGETWAAVGRATVKPGTEVTILDPMVMTDFESRAMQRKFDRIVLGTLKGATPPPAATAAAGAPHARAPDIGEVKVAKATGPNARTVAEVITRRTELKDKPVVLRAKVVKFTGEVLGKNWVHLRDGTGSAADRTDDVVATTKDIAKVGDVVLVQGTVRLDRDLGSGYTYKVLIEEARLQK